jgi:CrcB protein
VGSFLLGLTLALPGEWYIIFGSGLCGALTTFSGVSLQLHRRLVSQAYKPALAYISILLITGLLAAGAGMVIGENFI